MKLPSSPLCRPNCGCSSCDAKLAAARDARISKALTALGRLYWRAMAILVGAIVFVAVFSGCGGGGGEPDREPMTPAELKAALEAWNAPPPAQSASAPADPKNAINPPACATDPEVCS
jgi:hypothetical protein